MRLYQRDPGGVYQVEFSLPHAGKPVRVTTGERDRRLATVKAGAIVEAATRKWSRQEDLFASRDSYAWEHAVSDWNRERMRQDLASATIDFDGQNQRYLTEAKDGAGQPFFAGRLVRDIDGRVVADYITCAQALGLVAETIGKRLTTLRQILHSARARRGSDQRQLLAEMPPIPALGRSRSAAGWGRVISFEQYDRLLLALSTSTMTVPSLRRAIFELARGREVITAADVIAATGADPAYVRTELSRASDLDAPGAFLRRLHTRQAIPRGQPLRRYAVTVATLPPAPVAPVDHRGWVEICVWTAQHTADVNSFTPELFNLGPGPRVSPPPACLPLPPGSYLWRNTKNRRRTRGKIRDHVRSMDAELRACLERLAAERGLAPGIPVAGHWSRGNQHRDLCAAARRSGLGPILDDRGRTHLLSANDLRRTAATWLAEGLARRGSGPDKSATEVIAEFLGHAGLDVARGIYDRASGPRLGIVTSVFNELRAGRRGPKAVESVSHPQLAALPERK